jgi:hypothetical protein
MKKTKLPKKITPQIREYVAAVERGRKSQHIVKADEGWAIRSGGASRASKIFETQEGAAEYGKKIAKKLKATLFIHGKDGRIKESYSYSR